VGPDGQSRLGSLVRVFGTLGWRAFGGPAVHVALMEREVVGRRRTAQPLGVLVGAAAGALAAVAGS
jgi:hypothetical protein